MLDASGFSVCSIVITCVFSTLHSGLDRMQIRAEKRDSRNVASTKREEDFAGLGSLLISTRRS
jgi:hypothetical protein